MVTKEKPECPEARKCWYDREIVLCQLNRNKVCVLETGDTCEYYKEWLKEIRDE